MESLYVLTLRYLRKNYNLINFTVLNTDIAEDVVNIIVNPYYLSADSDIKCRYSYQTLDLDIYIVEHYSDSKWVSEQPAPDFTRDRIISFNRVPNSRFGQSTTTLNVYDRHTGKSYKVDWSFTAPFKRCIYNRDIERILPEFQANNSHFRDCTEMVEDQAFDIFPGLIEWAEKHDAISEQLKIPRELFHKK
jgi:hypothetical protein